MYGWPTARNSHHAARAIETCLNVIAKGAHANDAEAAFCRRGSGYPFARSDPSGHFFLKNSEV